MDGRVVCSNGVDTAVYIAGNDSQYSGTRFVVYPGRWFVIYDWGDILSVAQNEVFARGVASVCNWGQCMFLFCGIVWMRI